MWFIGFASPSSDYNMKTARLEMFARVSHSITGCIEAPIQMVLTISLMMMDLLPLPWQKVSDFEIKDSQGNEFSGSVQLITLATLAFSIIDMIKCAVMINIFNVYTGHIGNSKTFTYHCSLSFGHLPFFIHAICLRVFAYAFFVIYLNEKAFWVPIVSIWLLNLLIGESLYI